MNKKQKILFICTGNSCRSQMAEGFMKSLASKKFEAFSAGTSPSKVHPNAVIVMKEINIDISTHTSDSIDFYRDIGLDIIITVCDRAKKTCPAVLKSKNQFHWNIEDPFDGWNNRKELKKYRQVRDTINNKILNLLDLLEE